MTEESYTCIHGLRMRGHECEPDEKKANEAWDEVAQTISEVFEDQRYTKSIEKWYEHEFSPYPD